MLFKKLDEYIFNEIYPVFFVSYLLYTLTVLVGNIFNLIDLFVTHGKGIFTILRFLGYMLPGVSSITIPVAFLTAVLMGISRMSSDSEFLAMRSLGISFGRLLKSVFISAIPVFLFTIILTFYIAPYGNYLLTKNIVNLLVKEVEGYVKPQRFSFPTAKITIYIKDKDRDGWKNVFIHDTTPKNKSFTLLAERGEVRVNEKKKKVELYLYKGKMYLETEDKIVEGKFSYMVRALPSFGIFRRIDVGKRPDEMGMGELISTMEFFNDSPENKKLYLMNFHKRISIPFAVLIFALLGGVLGTIAERGSFSLSIGIVLLYYILLSWGENLTLAGIFPVFIGEWLPNIILFIISVVGVTYRERLSEVGFFKLKRDEKKRRVKVEGVGGRFKPKFLKIIDSYIGKLFLFIFTLSFLAFMGIFLVVAFLELIDDVVENKVSIVLLFKYLYYYIPQVSIYTIPISVLLGSLLTFGILERRNETTAIKAGGISLRRASTAIIIFSIFFSGVMFFIQETLLPDSNKKAFELRRIIHGRKKRKIIKGYTWLKGKEGFVYFFKYYNKEKKLFKELSIYKLDESMNSILFKVSAKAGALEDGELKVFDGRYYQIKNFEGKAEKFKVKKIPIPDDETLFSYEFPDPEEMNIVELKRFIDYLKENEASSVRYLSELYFKIFFPSTPLIMVFVGISFAFRIGKSGTLAGIGIAIFISFGYWFLFALLNSLAKAGMLHPLLSSAGTDLIFFLIGLYLFYKIKT